MTRRTQRLKKECLKHFTEKSEPEKKLSNVQAIALMEKYQEKNLNISQVEKN